MFKCVIYFKRIKKILKTLVVFKRIFVGIFEDSAAVRDEKSKKDRGC